MRFPYLRTTLLAGLLATNAAADSARTNYKSAALYMEPSPTSDRDNGTAIYIPATIDGENRASISVKDFVRKIMLINKPFVNGVRNNSRKLDRLVKRGMTPSEYWERQFLSMKMTGNLFADPFWRDWAFFTSKHAQSIGMNAYESIATTMVAEYSTRKLTRIFETAVAHSETKKFAIRLRNYVWQAQRLTTFNLLELMKLDLTVDKLFEHPQFAIYAAYVRFKWKKLNDFFYFRVEVEDFIKLYHEAAVVKILISPNNAETARGEAYLMELLMNWLYKEISPSAIGTLLVKEVDSQTFLHLELNIQVLIMWERYLSLYNSVNDDYQLTLIQSLTSTIGLAKSAMMLYTAVYAPQKKIRELAKLSVEDQFLEWLEDKKTPKGVSQLLKDSVSEVSLREYHLAKVASKWMKREYQRYYHYAHAPSIS